MRCPSCGTVHGLEPCPERDAGATQLSVTSSSDQSDQDHYVMNEPDVDLSVVGETSQQTSRLIEFPGVMRSTVPQWRKELSQRVRDVQDRRAREAALEKEAAERMRAEEAKASPPQLELLPQAEAPEVNPLVVAALKRIERAHRAPAPTASNYNTSAKASPSVSHVASGKTAAAVAPAMQQEVLRASEPAPIPNPPRNLVVVQSSATAETESLPDKNVPKAKRVLADDDPALSYLDRVTTSATTEAGVDHAPMFARLTAAAIDLLVITFLSLPIAAIIELRDGNWLDPRTLGIMGGGAAVVMFIYLTVTTALTGKTLGMRLLSLSAIDIRTGLIPTGKQSAGRALLYIMSLATLGIACCYALLNAERQTAHDRLSRTAVVKA